MVPDAKPPMPLVQSHSRDSAVARFPQISRPKSNPFIVSLHLSAAVRELGIERHPVVHEHGLAVDIVRVVGSEPHGGLADIRRLPDTAIRDQPEQRRRRPWACITGTSLSELDSRRRPRDSPDPATLRSYDS